MKNTTRVRAAAALAGAALALSAAPHATADASGGAGLVDLLGIAGSAGGEEGSSSRHADGPGRDLRSPGGDSGTRTTISGNAAEQSIGS
ncbi:hypothetical protein [Streptomyces sp. NPDC053755]|uniref:hypothetical protein n=1 Tax=Streptomyces sp. NPDC053755 TaxID=3155815 RepID=UPI003419F320